MARRKQSKSDRIRAALTELGPEARNRDIIEKLASENVKVSAQMVSTVRKRASGPVTPASGARSPGRPRKGQPVGSVSFSALLNAKHLVAQTGSLEAARQTLDALAVR
ncbi:MAG: hypothetical protein U0836_27600 [Pirellulales bacterium]